LKWARIGAVVNRALSSSKACSASGVHTTNPRHPKRIAEIAKPFTRHTKNQTDLSFTGITMPGPEDGSTETAPVVAANIDQSQSDLTRKLAGDGEMPKGGASAEAEDSGLSTPNSEWEDKRERKEVKEKKWKGEGTGRPDFRRAVPGAEAEQSTQQFFNRNKKRADEKRGDDIFDAPRKSVMGGALASALSAAAGFPQEGGTAQTPKIAAQPATEEGSKGGMQVGGEDMELVDEDVWMAEEGNGSEGRENVMATPPRWGTPTPSQERTSVPRSEGMVKKTPPALRASPNAGKRRAIGTPPGLRRVTRQSRPRTGAPISSAYVDVLVAVAALESSMNEKFGSLATRWEAAEMRISERIASLAHGCGQGLEAVELRLEERMVAMAKEEEEREEREANLWRGLGVDRERSGAARAAAEDELKETLRSMRLGLKMREEWEENQWGKLKEELEWHEKEIRAVKEGVLGIGQKLKKKEQRMVATEGAVAAAAAEELAVKRKVEAAEKVEKKKEMRAKEVAARNARPDYTKEATLQREVPKIVVSTLEDPVQPVVREVTMVDVEEDEVEGFSDMEGVQREGLFDSQHAPAAGEPDYMAYRATISEEKGEAARGKKAARKERAKAREEKGKAKEVVGVTRENPSAKGQPTAILKRPETVAAEVATDQARWERGDLNGTEQNIYRAAAGPVLDEKAETVTEMRSRSKRSHQAGMKALLQWVENGRPHTARRTAIAPRRAPPRAVVVPTASQQLSWAQRAAEAAMLPEVGMQRVGRKGKPEKTPTGLEVIKGSIPVDERWIAFERAVGAPQINAMVAANATGLVNVALSRVAPTHVRTEAFRITERGTLTASARMGASAAMLLQFKKEIIQAARQADSAIINVIACESWVELKILVPYDRYRGKQGLDDLREAIEAENGGVIIPPFSMKWMKSWRNYEEQWRKGSLPRGRASVIFKVPNKVAGRGLLKEIWVAGNRFQAEIFVPSKADSLCSICSMWGHSEFRCHSRKPACGICAGGHRTGEHKCEVATCEASARSCEHTKLECPNCGEAHQVQDRRCKMKMAAIAMARGEGQCGNRQQSPPQLPSQSRPSTTSAPKAAEWTETELDRAAAEDTAAGSASVENTAATEAVAENDPEMTASGIAPPMTS
jgi:hypothetical protein